MPRLFRHLAFRLSLLLSPSPLPNPYARRLDGSPWTAY